MVAEISQTLERAAPGADWAAWKHSGVGDNPHTCGSLHSPTRDRPRRGSAVDARAWKIAHRGSCPKMYCEGLAAYHLVAGC